MDHNPSERFLVAAQALTATGSVDEMAQAYETLYTQAYNAFMESALERQSEIGSLGRGAHVAARFLAERILDDLVDVGRRDGGSDEIVLTAKGRRAAGLLEPPRRVGTARKPGEEATLVG